jgi:hypothetical protein
MASQIPKYEGFWGQNLFRTAVGAEFKAPARFSREGLINNIG